MALRHSALRWMLAGCGAALPCLGATGVAAQPPERRASREAAISDELMAQAIEEGLAGNAAFGSVSCTARPAAEGGIRLVLRGPAGRIATSAARAIAAHEPFGAIPLSMMSNDITLDLTFVAIGSAQRAGLVPSITDIAIRPKTVRGRRAPDVAPTNRGGPPTGRAGSKGDRSNAVQLSALFRRADVPPEFDVVVRTRTGGDSELPWSCAFERDEAAKIR